MRILKLAWRVIWSDRRSLMAGSGAILIGVAMVSILGSVLVTARTTVMEVSRSSLYGEYFAEYPVGEVQGILQRLTQSEDGIRIAVRQISAGIVETASGPKMLTIVHSDLSEELRFSGLGPEPSEGGGFTRGDLLFWSPPGATDPRIGMTVGDNLPSASIPYVSIHQPDLESGQQAVIAVRGDHRSISGARSAWIEDLGFAPSGWRELGRRAVSPLVYPFVVVCAVVFALALLVLIPTNQLLVRRHLRELRLLSAWGMGPGIQRWVRLAMGTLTAAAAATAGSGLALAVLAIMRARGTTAARLMPGITALWGSGIPDLVVRPEPLVAAAAAMVAVAVGCVATLPSLRGTSTFHHSNNLWWS